MKVLLTGGAGYLGSVTTRLLLAAGFQVRVLDSLMFGDLGVRSLMDHRDFELIIGDIRSKELVKIALDGIEMVIHLAAIVGDPACAKYPELAQRVNTEYSLALFSMCSEQNVSRIVFASTCSNYGIMPGSVDYVTEDTDLQPLSLYAETKVEVENALFAESMGDGISYTVLRFATLFGLSPRMRFDLTVNEFTRELMLRKRLVVFGRQFWRPYVHVDDAARAISLVLRASPALVDRQVFNVGDTIQNYRKGELVDIIREEIEHQVDIENIEKKEDPRNYRVSFDKIKHHLDFNASLTVRDGVRQLTEALRGNIIRDPFNQRYRND